MKQANDIEITTEDIEIFFLDDDADFLDSQKMFMEAHGITSKITTFTDPVELERSLHNSVRIAIVDYWLYAHINGIQVIRNIKKKNPYCYFIMLSGQDSKSVVVEYLNAIHGGRYIEKGTPNCSKELVYYVKELTEVIKGVYAMVADIIRIKMKLTEMKNLLKNDSTDIITGADK